MDRSTMSASGSVPLAALALFLCLPMSACHSSKDTASTGLREDEDTAGQSTLDPYIVDRQYGFTSESWSYEVTLQGWAGLVTLDIEQDDATFSWAEEHDLENIDFASDGTWDIWAKTLFIIQDQEEQIDGASTLFSGTQERADSMTWMVTAYDMDLSTAVDCIVWGASPRLFHRQACRLWTDY